MLEDWIKWEPAAGLSKKYYIDSILDDVEKFEVTLSSAENEIKKIKVIFEDSVYSHCRTNESFRVKIIYDLDKKYGTDFYGDWTFFKVTNSSYLQWLSRQSTTISNSRNLVHFSFVAVDSILDVINVSDPKIEFISE